MFLTVSAENTPLFMSGLKSLVAAIVGIFVSKLLTIIFTNMSDETLVGALTDRRGASVLGLLLLAGCFLSRPLYLLTHKSHIEAVSLFSFLLGMAWISRMDGTTRSLLRYPNSFKENLPFRRSIHVDTNFGSRIDKFMSRRQERKSNPKEAVDSAVRWDGIRCNLCVGFCYSNTSGIFLRGNTDAVRQCRCGCTQRALLWVANDSCHYVIFDGDNKFLVHRRCIAFDCRRSDRIRRAVSICDTALHGKLCRESPISYFELQYK